MGIISASTKRPLQWLYASAIRPHGSDSTQQFATYHEEFDGVVAPEPVAKSQDIRNATETGKTVFELEDPSTTASRAKDAYLTNARELVDRIGGEPHE